MKRIGVNYDHKNLKLSYWILSLNFFCTSEDHQPARTGLQ